MVEETKVEVGKDMLKQLAARNSIRAANEGKMEA